jgi:hypothetical protein
MNKPFAFSWRNVLYYCELVSIAVNVAQKTMQSNTRAINYLYTPLFSPIRALVPFPLLRPYQTISPGPR